MVDAKQLLAEALRQPPDRLPDDAAMDTMEMWDSLTHMDLVALVEARCGFVLSAEDIVKMTSLRALEALLAERLGDGS